MHAFEDIAGLYREELRSLREDAVRFAVRNPGMARQLGLASDTQPDPLVNLLLESFAWLAARVRADAESRLPLVSHSLLGLLYPQFVCPIPSVGVRNSSPIRRAWPGCRTDSAFRRTPRSTTVTSAAACCAGGRPGL